MKLRFEVCIDVERTVHKIHGGGEITVKQVQDFIRGALVEYARHNYDSCAPAHPLSHKALMGKIMVARMVR